MKELLNRKLAAGLIAGSIALAGCAPTEQATPSFIKSFEAPSPTIIFSPSPTIDVTPTPSVEPSQSSEPTPSPTAEATPVPPVNDIKISPAGVLNVTGAVDKPWVAMDIVKPTLLDTVKENGVLLIDLGLPGKKITQTNCQFTIVNGHNVGNLCDYRGAMISDEITSKTRIVYPNGQFLGLGPSVFEKYAKAGDILSDTYVYLSADAWVGVTSTKQGSMNLATSNRLKADLGDPISKTKRIFPVYAQIVVVYPPGEQP